MEYFVVMSCLDVISGAELQSNRGEAAHVTRNKRGFKIDRLGSRLS